jgi:hypothetical protein
VRLPQPTTQEACRASGASTAAKRASSSVADNDGPGSLSLVVVPSGSMTAMFIRVVPAIGTGVYAVPLRPSSSCMRCPSGPPDRQDGQGLGAVGGEGASDVDALAARVDPAARTRG